MSSLKRLGGSLLAHIAQLDAKLLTHFVVSAITYAVTRAGLNIDPTVSAYISIAAGAVVGWFVRNAGSELRANRQPSPYRGTTSSTASHVSVLRTPYEPLGHNHPKPKTKPGPKPKAKPGPKPKAKPGPKPAARKPKGKS